MTASPNPMNVTQSVQELMQQHVRLLGDIHQAQLVTLGAALENQRTAMTGAVAKVAEKIDGQTSDFLAAMGQFTNDLG